ncbi:MAG: efflux RND transporter permease subunit, partial [Desulfarculaceae bacterium]|nr:efflux RND transporter permease subunit [Desulfarculaceae bacterium]
MNRIEKYLKNPHGITAVILLGAVFGFISFKSLPLNLFPDTNYPKVSVLFIQKGASARDMADNISRPVEKELAGLELVRTVSSSVRDETAAVSVEFEYEKTLDAAVTAVNTALNKIRASLPSDMQPPRVFRISEAVQPVQTLAVTPAQGSGLDLTRTRQLCDNEVLEAFLRVPGIADVEVFGGYRPEVEVALDRDVMASYGISQDQVLSSVYAFNRNIPVGTLTRDRDRILIRIAEERDFRHELGRIVIGMNSGSLVHLEDIAKIGIRHQERLSFYHGNGRPAVGLNILRPENGHVTTTLAALEKNLPKIGKQFENLNFEMADTQGELIRTSVNNLIGSLRDAVVLTVAVIFLMLAQTRMTVLAAVSIPFTFLLTFAGMKLTGYELNIVTMTAVILAVGLLVDDAIVVIENIEKHARFPDKTPFRASVDGTREIFLSDFGGTVTTLAVLLPIMFAGGYSEKILRPLTVVLSLALISSFVVSVTIIPLLAGKLT